MTAKKNKQEKVWVYCGECSNFTRDTTGISHTIDGEYFMGRCPFEEFKVFADKARECEKYRRK